MAALTTLNITEKNTNNSLLNKMELLLSVGQITLIGK